MRALLVVALAGCWHDAPPPRSPVEPPPATTDDAPYYSRTRARLDCAKVLAGVVERYEQNSPGLSGLKGVLLDVGTRSCVEDAWSEDVLACFRDSFEDKELQACVGRLTVEQRSAFEERFSLAMQNASAAPNTP